jgi:muramoyltetrapeptide carboxypeptidase
MIRPKALTSGDKVGIVAPGRKVSVNDIDAAKKAFSSWGVEIELTPNLFSEEHPYLSSSDDRRRDDFQRMLDDDRIRAIICARGGYGTTRILEKLDFSKFINTPKWVVGFSDITALHLKIFNLGIESIHAIMPILFDKPEYASSIVSLQRILFGQDISISAEASEHNKYGVVSGKVIGGNLSLLIDSLGTPSEPEAESNILIVEEIDEHLYKVDRMFTHLGRAGILKKIAGLVIGHMTALTDSELRFGETIEEIVLNKVSDFGYPVAFRFPIGHESPNLAWRHGSLMTLTVDENGSSLTPVRSV